MVFMIIIPFLNGYVIGNINPTFSDKAKWVVHGYDRMSMGFQWDLTMKTDRFMRYDRWFNNRKCEFDEIETSKNVEMVVVSSSIMGYNGWRVELQPKDVSPWKPAIVPCTPTSILSHVFPFQLGLSENVGYIPNEIAI